MKKESFLLVVGILVFITPFLGVPQSWIAVYLYVLGSTVVLIALSCRLHARRQDREQDSEMYHVEHDPARMIHPAAE